MQDICLMIKRAPPQWFKLCWCYITPGAIICLLGFIVVNHKAVTYAGYQYPDWSITVGWLIAMCSVVPVPIVAVYQLAQAEGSFSEVRKFTKKFVSLFLLLFVYFALTFIFKID